MMQRGTLKRDPTSPGKFSPGLAPNRKNPAGRSISGPDALLILQRSHGNAFVQRLVQQISPQRSDRFEGDRGLYPVSRRSSAAARTAPDANCRPGAGLPPTNCSAYAANKWWLPIAYVNNATCACRATPNSPSANCVRKFLQDRLASTSWGLKAVGAAMKPQEIVNPVVYQGFVQTTLTPRIHRDHVDAYRSCCCPSGPAAYPSWIGVTTVPIQPCSLVGASIRYFGSCHGTPGRW